MSLIAWFQKTRQWHREHVAAFAAITQKLEDGLTRFQHEAFYAVTPFIELKHVNRISSESGEGD